MKFSFKNNILIWFVLISIAVILLGRETYKNNKRYQDTVKWVLHTQQVLYISEQVLSINEDIETATRGYVLTYNEAFLDPFHNAKNIALSNLETLKKLTTDNPGQQKRIDTLFTLTKRKIEFSLLAVRTRKEQGFEAARELVSQRVGLLYMDGIRSVVTQLQKEENKLLKIRKDANDNSNAAFSKSYILELMAIVIAILVSSILIFINLNARKKAEKSLVENQLLLQAIIDNASSLIYIKNLDGKYLLANKKYEELLHISKDEIKGKTAFDIFSKAVATASHEIELKVIKEKRIITAEEDFDIHGNLQHYISTLCPLYRPNGKLYAICGISTNITEIKKQANLIKDLYDNAPCGYYSLDADGKCVNANKTTLSWLGYTMDELLERPFRDLVTEECKAEFDETFLVFKKTGVLNDRELTYIRKDGTHLPVLINASAVRDEKGNLLYSRSTIFDITERKKLEEELKGVNKELESFTYSVSHDLRAPLRIMNGYAGIIAEEYATVLDDDGNRMVNNIIGNAERMGLLIDDLLNFSRLGRKELLMQTTDMNSVVKQLVDEELKNFSSTKFSVRIDELGSCYCDVRLIKQVWQNLISNAFKYSSKNERPEIRISCAQKNGYTEYSIKDNGSGFDMKYYGKLFGVFQRLHNGSEYKGTGVGLALAQRIVTKHGGKIWAQAKVNEGATFYFSLKTNAAG